MQFDPATITITSNYLDSIIPIIYTGNDDDSVSLVVERIHLKGKLLHAILWNIQYIEHDYISFTTNAILLGHGFKIFIHLNQFKSMKYYVFFPDCPYRDYINQLELSGSTREISL